MPCQECGGYGAISCCEGAYSAKGVSAGERPLTALNFRPGGITIVPAGGLIDAAYILDRDTMIVAASNQGDAES